VDNEPVVVLRPSGVKVILVPGNNPPIIVEPSITTSVTIARSGIRGPKGDPGEATLPPVLDGGNF
jgi:hypothetical protein